MAEHTVTDNTCDLDGQDYTFDWAQEDTLLAAMLAAGIPAPHSCQMGQCGACRCVVEGPETSMKNNAVLSDADIAAGDRLACQTLRQAGETTPAEISYLF